MICFYSESSVPSWFPACALLQLLGLLSGPPSSEPGAVVDYQNLVRPV